MSRAMDKRSRGYFGVGIERSKTEANVGTLCRRDGRHVRPTNQEPCRMTHLRRAPEVAARLR